MICIYIYWKKYGYVRENDKDILLELYIPRINLRKFVYNMNSSFNNVDYNVEILESSNLSNNLFFLASHSGGGQGSYFDELIYLEKGDFIDINIKDKKIIFVVNEIFYIEKNGTYNVSYNSKGNVLFLITCSLQYINKQLVVKATLVYEC